MDKNSQQFVNMLHSAILKAAQKQKLNNSFQIQQSNLTCSKLKYSMCKLKTVNRIVICVEAQHSY